MGPIILCSLDIEDEYSELNHMHVLNVLDCILYYYKKRITHIVTKIIIGIYMCVIGVH